MKTDTLNIPALFFYGLLCGALAVVFMVSFRHFDNFYSPQIIARAEYLQAPAKEKKLENLRPQKVTLSYVSPSAKEVQVVGDFNAWGAYPLTLNKSGQEIEIFNITLALPRGKYKYHFLVDGQIVLDKSAPQTFFDGKFFNILEVK